jgi:glycosyltransferase involved in cell wall biosynthesis
VIFLIYSETETATIETNLGSPEYSYYFVLKEFRPVLEELGLVIPVTDPVHEVDAIWANAARHGEACVFLSFSPPHRTFVPAHCPTIPVFAWEFDTLPRETWDSDMRHDWRTVLRQTGRAVTHSNFAVATVKRAMGEDYPAISLPAPVWDRFAAIYDPRGAEADPRITVRGRVFDSREIDLAIHTPAYRAEHGIAPLPAAVERDELRGLRLGGVVYTSVLCPLDGRKNWFDMICGFCWALRDAADATLVLKLTHRDCDESIFNMLEDLAKLPPFRCRVVIIDGYLPDDSYLELARLSTYAVNTSHGEGQCLPLMEYMSAGKPAVAPDHTSMADYIHERNAFIVNSHPEPTIWPHDPRLAFRALRLRIDFESLLRAYRESYAVARHDPARYTRMAASAHEGLRRHCSRAGLRNGIRSFVLPAFETAQITPPEVVRLHG